MTTGTESLPLHSGAVSTPSRRRRDAVIYQIYPRSFQDSNGDGIGDIAGIIGRLDHLHDLGVDGIWLSPVFQSPQADFGYDVSDFTKLDPDYGTTEQLKQLFDEAHARDLLVLMDIVPCHTSIEHPWFREHPDWYIWAPGDGPPNNWVSLFGGPAWSRDHQTGRWYLHSFYPEQPDLNWRNPEVVDAMVDVLRFWTELGADGFRLDAINYMMKDADLRDEPAASEPFALMEREDYGQLKHVHTSNLPEVRDMIARMREALPASMLVGEVYRPTSDLPPYMRDLDMAFAFEFLQAPLDVQHLGRVVNEGAAVPGMAWVLSNHDFPRLVSRWGEEMARVAAMLLLTLPGGAFIYQGDEIGMVDGPGGERAYDRVGRDAYRHPMQWTPEGGFTTGTPWLPMVNPQSCNVEGQSGDPGSMLSLYRSLISLRRGMSGDWELLRAADEQLVYRRGAHTVALNLSAADCELPPGEVVLGTSDGVGGGRLPAHSGAVLVG
jgi:alpha-glucosidase